MNCPKCDHRMAPVVFEEIELDRCEHCGGLWLDMLELDKIRARGGSERIDDGPVDVGRRHDAIDRIACPRCTAAMIRMVDREHPDVHYEMCSTCGGIYLDAGELHELRTSGLMGLLRRLRTRTWM